MHDRSSGGKTVVPFRIPVIPARFQPFEMTTFPFSVVKKLLAIEHGVAIEWIDGNLLQFLQVVF